MSIANLMRLGWRDESRHQNEKWPIQWSGMSHGVAWTLSVSPARENSEGPKPEDHFWWTTDSIRSDVFLLIAGYTRFGSLDWAGQGGVQNFEEIESAVDAIMNEIGQAADAAMRTGSTTFVDDLVVIEERGYRERPFLTIGPFLESAQHAPLASPELQDVDVKAQDVQFARRLFDRGVISALGSCKEALKSPDSFIRIWVGAPNLRLHLAASVEDDDARLELCRRVVELGAALASGCQRAAPPAST